MSGGHGSRAVEEIIGEIQDEHEADEPMNFEQLPDGRTLIWGGVAVREVNDRLDLSLPENPHDRLGGYVFGALNRIGRVGDVVEFDGGRFQITEMRGRRVEYVVLLQEPGPPPAGAPRAGAPPAGAPPAM